MEIAQTRKNLMQAWKVYFKCFSSEKMAQTKSTVKRRAETGTSTSTSGISIPQPHPASTSPAQTMTKMAIGKCPKN